MMNFGLECLAYLARRSGKINYHTAGVYHVDVKAMRLKPRGNPLEARLRGSEFLPKFLRRQPVVKIRRALRVEFVDELLENFFLFGGALELKQHVLQQKCVRHSAAIISAMGFWSYVADQRDASCFVNRLNDSGPRTKPGFGFHLSGRAKRIKQQGCNQQGSGSEWQLANHGSPFLRGKFGRAAGKLSLLARVPDFETFGRCRKLRFHGRTLLPRQVSSRFGRTERPDCRTKSSYGIRCRQRSEGTVLGQQA